MKKFKLSTLFLAVSVLMVITSCKKTEVDPVAPKNSSTDDSQNTLKSAAQVYYFSRTIDLSAPGWSEFNACTGEPLKVVKGIWHLDFHMVINGNRGTLIDRSNVSDYKLIDETTGVEYTGSYVSNYSETGSVNGSGFPYEYSGHGKILLTTPGKDNNGQLLIDVHGTVNANGEWTVDSYNVRSDCQ